MKIFLFTVTLFEGAHQHTKYVLIKAEDRETAWQIGVKETHEIVDEDHGYWNYGDGSTATTPKAIQEISPKDAEVLTRLGIVFYLN